jgi:prophage tail gpP-like protein
MPSDRVSINQSASDAFDAAARRNGTIPQDRGFIRTGGLLTDDAIQIIINGTSYQGWTELDIDSDLLNPADQFIVSGTIPKASPTTEEVRAGAPSNGFDDFREGNFCDVYVGLDRQMAGVIDDVEMSGDRSSARLKISGRDKGAFLVDGEANHIKAANYTVKTLFQALIPSSWGIRNIILSNEDNRSLLLGKRDKKKPKASTPSILQPISRKRTKIDPGQRIASIFDIHCQRLGITWWLTAQGDLFIGKPNYNQEAAYHFESPASWENGSSDKRYLVESWRVKRSIRDRFSETKVVAQGWSEPAKVWDITANPLTLATADSHWHPGHVATARDSDLVERGIVRKQIVSDGDAASQGEVQSRADSESSKRQIGGLVITLTVPDFRQGDRLYAVDTIATVSIEEAGIDGKYYVTQRRFTENRGQRRTQLTLVQPGIWLA